LRGPHLDDVFAHLARPKDVPALERSARANAHALPLTQLTERAAAQLGRVTALLADHSPTGTTTAGPPKDNEWT
ncbi:hypothetical protein ACF1G3_37570, partial [Streptomyces rochei]|uniref:hypothetical protein n=1 Tax=Streptomyces rochei TaxID=1928 RepID=UPI0036FD95C4